MLSRFSRQCQLLEGQRAPRHFRTRRGEHRDRYPESSYSQDCYPNWPAIWRSRSAPPACAQRIAGFARRGPGRRLGRRDQRFAGLVWLGSGGAALAACGVALAFRIKGKHSHITSKWIAMSKDDVYVSITGLRLSGRRHMLRFWWHAVRSMAQARRAPGNLRAETRTIEGVRRTLSQSGPINVRCEHSSARAHTAMP